MSTKTKSGNRKRILEEEDNLDYNELASMTAASPLQHRGKKTKSKAINKKSTATAATAVVNMEESSPVKASVVGKKRTPVKSKVSSPVSSPIAPGTKVRISKKAQKHTQFRGKTGTVVSHSGQWVKVELMDEDGEESILSFSRQFVEMGTARQEEEEEEESPVKSKTSSANKKKRSPSSTGRSNVLVSESYPQRSDETTENVSSAALIRTLGHGEGLASGESAAALTKLVLKHELDFLRESVSGKDADAVVKYFGAISEQSVDQIPQDVETSRQRRLKALFKSREKEMSERYALLKQEESKWKSIKNSVESGSYEVLNTIIKQMAKEDTTQEEGDELLDDPSVDGTDVLNELKKVKVNVETMVLALDEKAAEVRRVEDLAEEASLVQQRLVQLNKQHHFDDYPANTTTNVKDLLKQFTAN